MRRIAGALAALCLTTGIAAAADPTGEWLVADKVAKIKIENCKGAYWGVISWEKEPGVDKENPDAAKRTRPTLGMPIILGMKPSDPNKWEGQIYNAENGKTYTASISLDNPDLLNVRGCVMGFLCGGEKWTRVKAETTGRAAPPPGSPAPKTTAAAAPAQKSVCSAVGT
ncbi:hypothetical protein GJW-30_1_02148 [Variibacter gotjawalensis]|uniref:DUF2147 domain-containing protein n=1 Tax=Variibacter gotjawalensis TaxID=1333996 RepID=A0A0S3PUI5_9BRAD|nr:DUF2147 domain-containing protein [Variibacter gotjawalensis]NIK49941.1 uncharacterized protein (DUF2147 family) [Variibacter gotjawalensis]RZS45940.1 uncharacterized protein (DUF2147 family) [Variibacter gotjawalensis]BAT59615.1 hypothetical protein GJW-30_1_02148 [Variibacter gotjawalensis]